MQMIDKTTRHRSRRAIGLRYYLGAIAIFGALIAIDPLSIL